MISLHSMLAAASSSESTDGNILIPVAIIAAVALIVIAFFVGFKKGIRRIGWKGFTWVLSGGLFLVLKGVLASDGDAIMTIVTAVICAVVGMILYNVCSWIFRPRMKWSRLKNFDRRNKADNLEYEADYSEYDSMVAKDYVAINNGMKPGFLERVLGGVGCIFNLFVVIIAIALAALTFINMSQIDLGLADMNKYFGMGTDFVIIGFMILLGCVGFERGFFCGLRWIFTTFGSLIALGGAAAVVFLFGDKVEVLGNLVQTVADFFVGTPLESLGDILSKVIVSAVLFIPMLIVIALLNYILGALARGIRGTQPTRLVDGLIGTLILIVIAVVLTVVITELCYVLQVKEIFFTNVESYLEGFTSLGKAVLTVCKDMIHPLLPL